jgi:integrase
MQGHGDRALDRHRHQSPHEGNPHPTEAVLSLQRVHQSREHLEAQDPGKHAQHPSERRTLGGTAGIAPKGLLFPNEDGNPDVHFLDKLKRNVKNSGVAQVKLHRFRDTFITNKLRDGVDIRTVQRWAGHDDINVTMSYAAWLDAQSEAARNAANREDTRYKTGTNGD